MNAGCGAGGARVVVAEYHDDEEPAFVRGLGLPIPLSLMFSLAANSPGSSSMLTCSGSVQVVDGMRLHVGRGNLNIPLSLGKGSSIHRGG